MSRNRSGRRSGQDDSRFGPFGNRGVKKNSSFRRLQVTCAWRDDSGGEERETVEDEVRSGWRGKRMLRPADREPQTSAMPISRRDIGETAELRHPAWRAPPRVQRSERRLST